ncbi:phosphoglycerate mutase-like protein [Mytilinidion resinicola]|uniref:3-phytase n=1 Tax=Mytilinidion resinicola TaxID=574789 RepID=A0A6A6YHB3_9PEZI|nr:phosphoglycerate mutase-like protein [Mytilinidion resinicola]KAF2808206.1 phosphoglycerate mutase-like protein [Mytilinidion resinicola]
MTCLARTAVIDVRKASPAISESSEVPDYFDTTLGWFAGPTATGDSPWLAQTNAAPFPGVSYIPNAPLETQIPIRGNKHGKNIFELLANLSPYFPNSRGFGVNEYSLPAGSSVSWVNMVSRHGSRYPAAGSDAEKLGLKINSAARKFKATGPLSFLNSWKYGMGEETLVPIGKQELFNSGTLHYYQYGHIYPNNGRKIVARTTTEKRMLESAEYFLAGFFGLAWPSKARLEVIIEEPGYNNTLMGDYDCPNVDLGVSRGGYNAWIATYLEDATKRFQGMVSGGLAWSVKDTYAAQQLCAFETVALGYSRWCSLFTLEEWQGFEYSIDIKFSGGYGFQSPTGRANEIGYVQEVLARMTHHTITSPTDNMNVTLDNNTVTFPVDQALNFDFSHDTNILGIMTAFGLTQFNKTLPSTHIVERELIVSHVTPFAARLDIEIIKTPQPVNADRSAKEVYLPGPPTSYVHFVLNQRTVPLGLSLQECGQRDDGWCEMETFLKVQRAQIELVNFTYACFGDYEPVPYGEITNGVPL